MKPYKEWMRDAEREYMDLLLRETQGAITEASKISGINRTCIYRLLRRAGVPYKRNSAYSNEGNADWRALG